VGFWTLAFFLLLFMGGPFFWVPVAWSILTAVLLIIFCFMASRSIQNYQARETDRPDN
jgi:heme exporter protein D